MGVDYFHGVHAVSDFDQAIRPAPAKRTSSSSIGNQDGRVERLTSMSHNARRHLGFILVGVALLATACFGEAPEDDVFASLPIEPESAAARVADTDGEIVEGDPDPARELPPVAGEIVYEGPACTAEFLTTDLPGNRGNSIPSDTVNVVLFYDGNADPQVEVRLGLTDGGWIPIGGEAPGGVIDVFGEQLETRVYRTHGCTISGEYEVSGVIPNGVIDGIAVSVLARDDQGRFTTWRSSRSEPIAQADFVGMWPLGFSNESLREWSPQITDSFGRETARAMIIGAQLVDNGSHRF